MRILSCDSNIYIKRQRVTQRIAKIKQKLTEHEMLLALHADDRFLLRPSE